MYMHMCILCDIQYVCIHATCTCNVRCLCFHFLTVQGSWQEDFKETCCKENNPRCGKSKHQLVYTYKYLHCIVPNVHVHVYICMSLDSYFFSLSSSSPACPLFSLNNYLFLLPSLLLPSSLTFSFSLSLCLFIFTSIPSLSPFLSLPLSLGF